jgi:mono/diheme cytochrome c family protein
MRNLEQFMIFLEAPSRPRRSSLPAVRTLGLIAVILSLNCAVALAVEPGAAPNVKQGDEIFHKRCIACHNKQPDDNSPFGPPNLYAVFRARPTLTTAQAETIITGGKGQMPSFKAILTRAEIRSVIAYLRSRSQAKSPQK